MKWIAVCLAMIVTDYFWARWAAHVAVKNTLKASLYASLIIFCSAFTILEYTTDPWLVIPAAIGAAIGTFVAVKFD